MTQERPATAVVLRDGRGEVEVVALVVAGHVDLGLIASLARLQLAARRAGWSVHLRDATVELCELIELVGLAGVLAADAPPSMSSTPPGRQTVQRTEREETTMSLPKVVSRDEWVAARKALLVKEKALTRARDALNTERRQLPMVEIDKPYIFEGPGGAATLLDLFEGRRQLILVHFMFGPTWDEGCPSCTAGADEISDGLLTHLHARDTTLVEVARAPLAKIEAYKAKRGWTFPWYSSYGSDFNYDFHVTLDEEVEPVEYNFRTPAEHEQAGTAYYVDGERPVEAPGVSFFLRDGDRVFHTNSVYARGAEMTGGSYYFLDLTALGRQEEWEEPKGRSDDVRANVPDFAT